MKAEITSKTHRVIIEPPIDPQKATRFGLLRAVIKHFLSIERNRREFDIKIY